MQFLVMTLEAPLMAFPGPVIDGIGNTGRLPGLSFLTGLIGNALGYDRTDFERLADLQSQIVFAAREDRPGREMMDFQTAKLGHKDRAWTRSGVEGRAGGAATYDNPIIRRRPYLADHAVTLVLGLRPGDLDLDDVLAALRHPARPIFLGRKSFPPATPIADARRPLTISAEDARAALAMVPALPGTDATEMWACWPADNGDGQLVSTHDVRDFWAQRHAGTRQHKEGRISVTAA